MWSLAWPWPRPWLEQARNGAERCSAVGGISDLIENEDTSILVPAKDRIFMRSISNGLMAYGAWRQLQIRRSSLFPGGADYGIDSRSITDC